MAYTTYDAVSGIVTMKDSITTDAAPYIETANFLVTKLCEPATDEDGNLYHDSTSLELVERWLSAHFYSIHDVRPDTQKADVVMKKVQYKVELNLAQTQYGQQAMLIDISGALASWNDDVTSGKTALRVSTSWGGLPVSEQTVYSDRD